MGHDANHKNTITIDEYTNDVIPLDKTYKRNRKCDITKEAPSDHGFVSKNQDESRISKCINQVPSIFAVQTITKRIDKRMLN